jgi:hypothetical protein
MNLKYTRLENFELRLDLNTPLTFHTWRLLRPRHDGISYIGIDVEYAVTEAGDVEVIEIIGVFVAVWINARLESTNIISALQPETVDRIREEILSHDNHDNAA